MIYRTNEQQFWEMNQTQEKESECNYFIDLISGEQINWENVVVEKSNSCETMIAAVNEENDSWECNIAK